MPPKRAVSSPASAKRPASAAASPASASTKAKKPRTVPTADSPGTLPSFFAQAKEAPHTPLTKERAESEGSHAAAASPATTTPDTTVEPEPAIVHVQLSEEDETVLRSFDHEQSFGPCLGPTRLQRWRRAEKWGLHPPHRVLTILEGLHQTHPAHDSVLAKYPCV